MARKAVVIPVIASLFVLGFAVGAAFAPYHTAPTPPPGGAGSSGLSAAKAQAKTAAAHAGFAAEGGTVSYAKEHLGHALVCIEGPRGANVNAAWENPCGGMGNGVLPDLQRANADAALIAKAKDADAAAVAAMKGTNLAEIKASAKQVSTLMQQIAEAR